MTQRPPHRHYLLLSTLLVLAALGCVAAINLFVDPYGMYGFVFKRGVNEVKPHAGANGVMAKAYQVQRVRPSTLILGNSRAEVGFNPMSASWPSALQPVYNAALPGAYPITSLRYLQHVIAVQTPEAVVLGVDLMDYLVREDEASGPARTGQALEERRLLVTYQGAPNPAYRRQRFEDFAASVLSLDAFIHSINTLAAQSRPDAQDLTPQGFNPMRDYAGIARREGYEIMFRQRDEENARAYARRPKNIYRAGASTSSQLEILRSLIAVCRERGITLHLAIYPYHAHLLETFHALALWPAFEEWKRALTRLVDESNRLQAIPAVKLWDFSGYNAYSTEQAPAPGDKKSEMRWYWEAGHFKQALGEEILHTIFARAGQDANSAFGVQLTPSNIEREIERIRREHVWYETTQDASARKIRQLVDRVKGSR